MGTTREAEGCRRTASGSLVSIGSIPKPMPLVEQRERPCGYGRVHNTTHSGSTVG